MKGRYEKPRFTSREEHLLLLVLPGVYAFAGHDWIAVNVGKTIAAVVAIALIVLAGIGISDDVQDVLAIDAPA